MLLVVDYHDALMFPKESDKKTQVLASGFNHIHQQLNTVLNTYYTHRDNKITRHMYYDHDSSPSR